MKIADLGVSQATSFHWCSCSLQRGLETDISVERYGRVEQVAKIAEPYDLIILDGAPYATQATLQITQASQLVIPPTGLAVDDLQPGVQLTHELAIHIPRQRLVFTLCRVGISQYVGIPDDPAAAAPAEKTSWLTSRSSRSPLTARARRLSKLRSARTF